MAGLALDLDRAGTVPLYDQVAQQLQAAIEDGTLSQGTLLGNEITLARELGVSRPTMRRAMQELVTRGLLVRKRGVGTQVVQGRVDRQVQLTSLFDDLVADGRAPETTVLINDVVQASDEVSAALHVARRQPVLHLRRIRSAGGEPLAILENLPADGPAPGGGVGPALRGALSGDARGRGADEGRQAADRRPRGPDRGMPAAGRAGDKPAADDGPDHPVRHRGAGGNGAGMSTGPAGTRSASPSPGADPRSRPCAPSAVIMS